MCIIVGGERGVVMDHNDVKQISLDETNHIQGNCTKYLQNTLQNLATNRKIQYRQA